MEAHRRCDHPTYRLVVQYTLPLQHTSTTTFDMRAADQYVGACCVTCGAGVEDVAPLAATYVLTRRTDDA